jgi:hypothetical protein
MDNFIGRFCRSRATSIDRTRVGTKRAPPWDMLPLAPAVGGVFGCAREARVVLTNVARRNGKPIATPSTALRAQRRRARVREE